LPWNASDIDSSSLLRVRRTMRRNLVIRDAVPLDIPRLEQIKRPAVLHADRIRDAASGDFRYLVLEDEFTDIVGHACLVFRRPKAWPPDAGGALHPRIVDLRIRRDKRNQGIGKEFMRQMEGICRELGYNRIYLGVAPEDKKGAVKFYEALGYVAMPDGPRWRKWSFKDSEGNLHQGEGMEIEVYKVIA
jgi:GNAT superfamily N-acetyltransferase